LCNSASGSAFNIAYSVIPLKTKGLLEKIFYCQNVYLLIAKKGTEAKKMLVLSRKLGEFLILNDNIFISVFEGGAGDKVKIAIEAPEDVKIARSEMFEGCEEVQKKLDAIRSKRVGKRTKKTRKEMERLGVVTSPAPAE